MGKTKIPWATYVWSVVTGCTKMSTGCKNCWAKTLHDRRYKAFWSGKPMPEQYRQRFEVVQTHPDRLDEPLHWRKPQVIFVASGGDLFHEDILGEFIDRVFETMHLAYWHMFIILTKRPALMKAYIDGRYRPGMTLPLSNVWLGVSVENQATANERIPLLLQTPAAKHIVSVEPMLERIDLCIYYADKFSFGMDREIDWVIAGDESGTNARPSPSLDDVRFLRDQCLEAGVPFFLKQLGGVKMPELDGRTWDHVPGV
jgi:protein gp37